MSSNNSIFKKDYKISSLNINTNKRLGLFGLLSILQDISEDHSFELGMGYEESKKMGFFWILLRQRLRMTSWPKWYDLVTIHTWTKPVVGISGFREYEIFVNNKKIGDCSTTWLILDNETRRPKKLDNANNLFNPRTDYSLEYTSDKVILPKEIKSIKTFDVRISDLDMNQHVNNTKYSQWILDSIPFDYHSLYKIIDFEINFSGETFLGDNIECFSDIGMKKSDSKYMSYFKGNRIKDSKTVFIAKLLTEAIDKG